MDLSKQRIKYPKVVGLAGVIIARESVSFGSAAALSRFIPRLPLSPKGALSGNQGHVVLVSLNAILIAGFDMIARLCALPYIFGNVHPIVNTNRQKGHGPVYVLQSREKGW